jgi:hypothetical protein
MMNMLLADVIILVLAAGSVWNIELTLGLFSREKSYNPSQSFSLDRNSQQSALTESDL